MELGIVYEGHDITREISPFVVSFTFTDNSSGKADDISLTLMDRDSLWLKHWTPSKGDKITPRITRGTTELQCGTFEVDQVEYSYPPHVMTLKGVSVNVSGHGRYEPHNDAWEDETLRGIAHLIAESHGYELYYDAPRYPMSYTEQVQESDVSFLEGLCSRYGLSVKVSNDTLIIYSESDESESGNTLGTLHGTDMRIISVKFSSKGSRVYKKARLTYHNPVQNEDYYAEADDDSVEGSGQILMLNEPAGSQGEANEKAREILRAANLSEVTGTIALLGSTDYLAGLNITLEDFGMFSGKYFLDKVTHTVSNGWTTSLSLKMGSGSKAAMKARKVASKKKGTKSTGGEIYAPDEWGY